VCQLHWTQDLLWRSSHTLFFSYSFLRVLKVTRPKLTGWICVSMYHSLLVITVSALRKHGELFMNLNKRHGVVATTIAFRCARILVHVTLHSLPFSFMHLRGL
jgi:hypothetical protein